ncbi:MAG: hypothetical protein ACOZNI_06455 [Myxococcota bacterium]
MIAALVAVAAASPDRVAASATLGAELADVAVAAEAEWAAVTDTGGFLHVVDLGTWDVTTLAVCSSPGGVAPDPGEGVVTFWVGCGDGTVVPVVADGDTRVPEAGDAVSVADGAILAVESDGTNVYVVVEGDSGVAVDAFVADDASEVSGFPTEALSGDGLEDSVLLGSLLVVVHGGSDTSKVDLATGAASADDSQTSGGRTFGDAYGYGETTVFLADEGGDVIKLTTGEMEYSIAIDNVLDAVSAVGVAEDDGWIAAAGDGVVSVHAFADGLATADADAEIEGVADVEEIGTFDAYALAATSAGELHVLTDVPWVEITSDVPATVVTGDVVTLTFTSDVEGSYDVLADGSSETLASGEIAAGGEATVDVEVPTDWEEGTQRLRVEVTASARVGHDAVDVKVDNPPEALDLSADFGDRRVYVQIEGIDAEDLDHYTIFMTVSPFDPDDWETGGPVFDGEDDVELPAIVTAEPGEDVKKGFSPLTNGVTYYVAARAVDASGQEGPMTEPVAVTPVETFSMSQLSGEDGGFFCGTRAPAGLAAVALAGLALVARRRTGVLVAGALLAPGLAHAKPENETTPRKGHFAARYGVFEPADPYLQAGFGDTTNKVLRIDYGWTTRWVEAGMGVGLVSEQGYLLTEDLQRSADEDLLQILPVDVTLTLRLDIWDEQLLVPFLRGGGDAWLWREVWDPAPGEDDDGVRYGGKLGGHWAAGGLLLLDVLDQRGASKLEAHTGINDTYIAGEYRRTYMLHSGDSLDLSAAEYTFGLKFDF